MSRVPVHVVTGSDRALAGVFMGRCAAARSEWAMLELATCPCCSGRVELQVRLARMLRERRAARVLIGFVELSHHAALERVLSSWPLSQYVVPGRPLSMPQDAALSPEALEAA